MALVFLTGQVFQWISPCLQEGDRRRRVLLLNVGFLLAYTWLESLVDQFGISLPLQAILP